LFEKQSILQERLGRLPLARKSNMKEKCDILKDDIYNVVEELHEMMRELPHKHWKKYSKKFIKDWMSEEHREKTLFEYIDALHFFINIGLILEFSAEEIFEAYIKKNQINHERQNNGY
jgi:dimeric dUTPase (all-alpha-NTP-PPase superfamily)